MKLYVLHCGEMSDERGFLWHFGTVEDTGKEYQSVPFRHGKSIYFIDHPRAKIIFDLGWKLADFKEGAFPGHRGPDGRSLIQAPDENPPAQLARIGIKVDDIDYVVLSHMMEEHAGYLPEFAGKKARIVVQKKEYEYATRIGTPNKGGPPVEQFHTWMYRRHMFEVPGLKYKIIEGDKELVKDVWVLHAPGHTPGYQVLKVKLPKTGVVVMSPCEHLGMYYATPINGTGPGIPHAFTWFAGQELATFKKIKDMVAREGGQLFCGHDPDQYKNLKHAPDYYD